MLPILAALVLAQTPAQPETYQRVSLPNGAVVLARKMPKQAAASIQLFASAKFVPDAPLTHGYRHLLEHLMSRAAHVDGDLERAGGMLFAHTTRDCMQFEINLPSTNIEVGIQAVKKLLTPHPIYADQITQEVATIREEGALSDPETKFSEGAWQEAYGDNGLSPMGELKVMAGATPEELEVVRSATFCGRGVAAVIVGNIDPGPAANALADALADLPRDPGLPVVARPLGKPGSTQVDVPGEARAAITVAFDRPSAAAELAAAFAIAGEMPGCFVTYTPTMERGLVIVGRTDADSGLGTMIDGLRRETMEPLFARGKALARRWFDAQMGTAGGSASLRGRLLCADHGAEPDQFLRQLNAVTLEDFLEGIRAFQSGKGIVVEGSGR